MSPMSPFRAVVLLLATTVMLSDAAKIAQQNRNVMLLFIDDGGFEMSPYGNSKIHTPNIEDLAKNSVQFNNAFTSVSICSPSRAVLLTGLPSHQNGMYGLNHGHEHFSCFDEIYSLPRLMQETGQYMTLIIGKSHIGPAHVFPFDYNFSNEVANINDVGRNITYMKNIVGNFLADAQANQKPFFAYISFFDVHRAQFYENPEWGQFLENWGDGTSGFGVIPDWDPITYSPDEVEVPYFTQDTLTARKDIAALYKCTSRLDQGIAIMLQLLKDYGFDQNTLVILSSDNGVAFPGAKGSFYEAGVGEPMFISNPLHPERFGEKTDAMASLMDIVPTMMDWYGMDVNSLPIPLTGKSLIPVTESEPTEGFDKVFSSTNFLEINADYPVRMIRTREYKLLHNLYYETPAKNTFDVILSPTHQELLEDDSKWYKTLQEFYHRCEWELYDIVNDPQELNNLAYDMHYQDVLTQLQNDLHEWLVATNDPWQCNPEGVINIDGTCQNQRFYG